MITKLTRVLTSRRKFRTQTPKSSPNSCLDCANSSLLCMDDYVFDKSIFYYFPTFILLSSYYGETDRHLNFRSGEHIGISPLTFRKVKLSRESAIRDHLPNCSNFPSFGEFTILEYGHHKYILEIKESFLIKRDRPVLNKNISSAKLFLFNNN